MPLVVTEAVVLHSMDYLETSRILRLATRDGGLQTVVARGARRSRKRYGSALDLFAGGEAQIYTKSGRDMHTLGAFEVTRSRHELSLHLARFSAASALAELVLRFASGDEQPALYDAIVSGFDAIASAAPDEAAEAGLSAVWRLIAELGFAPSVDACSRCHAPVARDQPAMFSHPAGGVLCDRCARLVPGSRTVPAEARVAVAAWLGGARSPLADDGVARAHQRLLREFLREHLTDGRPLRAFELWERERGGAA